MGINDRDYGRYGYDDGYGYRDQPGLHFGGVQSVTVKIVIVTAIVFVVQLVFRAPPPGSWFDQLFALHSDWLFAPWGLLTYGFLHDPWKLWHIAGNMFVLWMFGRMVEDRYGGKEFLAFYLASIVFAGLFWSLTVLIAGQQATVIGASGGVSAVLLLFIILYPRVTILFMFFIPMPAWVLGVFIVGSDMLGAFGGGGGVAFTAHLGGFLFAYLYYKSGIRLMNYLPTGAKMPSLKRRPKLKVHRPENQEDKKKLRLDQLLEKIAASGQDSLSSSERRELQKLSKYYKDKRR
ncbi:rhomboid family intramembrane serine protease [Aeoliella sp. ICT_H6.2]|uniref:Rhomboid family intramembrane serine protease n=1 Tax=Aeoliella straminimaris TaxID=2954799 RepID=A0A9X2JFR6_9BACT|nr:rhomboid family intramembrane serine protease [Aeoliella straminimaris]MCO6043991.1 rhomboid family intramembrane serine protease [Aeoliella straminimaris]